MLRGCIQVSGWSLCILLMLLQPKFEQMRSPFAMQRQEEGALHRKFGVSRSITVRVRAGDHGDNTDIKPNHKPQPQPGNAKQPAGPVEPLVLGYSILQEDKVVGSERILLTRSEKVFQLGDRVRLLIETNADGYLYVFNTLEGKDPEMIFPSYRLNRRLQILWLGPVPRIC
jgi:hypothetical protein